MTQEELDRDMYVHCLCGVGVCELTGDVGIITGGARRRRMARLRARVGLWRPLMSTLGRWAMEILTWPSDGFRNRHGRVMDPDMDVRTAVSFLHPRYLERGRLLVKGCYTSLARRACDMRAVSSVGQCQVPSITFLRTSLINACLCDAMRGDSFNRCFAFASITSETSPSSETRLARTECTPQHFAQ